MTVARASYGYLETSFMRQLLSSWNREASLNDWEGQQTDKEDTNYIAFKRVIVCVYAHPHANTDISVPGKTDSSLFTQVCYIIVGFV